jgi:hypothetical protein
MVQTIRVKVETPMTKGTKIPAILSKNIELPIKIQD